MLEYIEVDRLLESPKADGPKVRGFVATGAPCIPVPVTRSGEITLLVLMTLWCFFAVVPLMNVTAGCVYMAEEYTGFRFMRGFGQAIPHFSRMSALGVSDLDLGRSAQNRRATHLVVPAGRRK